MLYRLLPISLVVLVKLTFPDGVETLQSFKAGYYGVILKNKTVPNNSSNLIKSFQSKKKLLCLVDCNQNFLCMLVIYNKTSWCSLYKIGAINELINTTNGEETTVYQSQISNGLINYWPIVNDLKDYIGSSDMTTGPLDANEEIGFTLDRFNNPNGSIIMNPGYYILPPGIYFYNSFSFLVWIKVLSYVTFARLIDCGNGASSDNVLISIADNTNFTRPYMKIFRNDTQAGFVSSSTALSNTTWTHLAFVYDGLNLMMYVNAQLVGNTIPSAPPTVIERQKCYIGRTNWAGTADVSACLDDLMIYNRSLTANEIQILMNYSFK